MEAGKHTVESHKKSTEPVHILMHDDAPWEGMGACLHIICMVRLRTQR
jgi:hypothetical protein